MSTAMIVIQRFIAKTLVAQEKGNVQAEREGETR
jgi:hypothetical protein